MTGRTVAHFFLGAAVVFAGLVVFGFATNRGNGLTGPMGAIATEFQNWRSHPAVRVAIYAAGGYLAVRVLR